MKLSLLTNVVSHYQMALAQSLADTLGKDNFRLIVLRPLDEVRTQMGWQDDYQQDFLLKYWQPESKAEIQQWIDNADVVIQGRVPSDMVRQRIAAGKLTFAYQERLWKKGFWRLRNLLRLFSLYRNYWSLDRPNYHFLAAGSFASSDIAKIGCFKGRKWRFGYFIDSPLSESQIQRSQLPKQGDMLKVVWCGSLIDWKQPERLIELAKAFKNNNQSACIDVIGDGPLRAKLEQTISQYQLEQTIVLHGFKPREQIDDFMQSADVFLLTSNHREGWGVVVNEAMAQGCCVIANELAGASRWLVQHGKTGWLYPDDSFNQVIERLTNETISAREFRRLGEQGTQLHQQHWSAQVAAKRLVYLAQGLLDGQDMRHAYTEGVCSYDGHL